MVLHSLQCFPSVKPGFVHVASTAASITSVCPKAAISSCAINMVSHSLQCFPSVKPGFVHVASTAASITSVCPKADTILSLYVSLHNEHVYFV